MAKRKVFKKNLTPIGRRGRVNTMAGKGANEQRMRPGQQESLTGGDPFARVAGAYPKDALPPPQPAGAAPSMPSAMMPGGLGMGVPDEEV